MAHIKDSQSYHFSAQPPKRDLSLSKAIVIALIVHVGIIFGISFTTGQEPAAMIQDVAKALSENLQPNEDAQFIANASQQGGGSIEEQIRQESAQTSPLVAQQTQETQDIITLQKQVRQQRYQAICGRL